MIAGLPKLFAIIAVAYVGGRTLYVKRSERMENYPGVWSLPSVQFDPGELTGRKDMRRVLTYLRKMSNQRLGGAKISVLDLLTSGSSDVNPISRDVHLFLYRIALEEEPALNPDFYTDMKWMTAAEFEDVSAGQTCGLCVRLWADHAWLLGLTDRPFNPRIAAYAT